MEVSGLLTSLGINMGICVLLFCVYSILRKQPSNRGVYFARSLAQMRSENQDPHWFDRFVPSPRWILQAWELTDEEIIRIGGLDAVVFVKAVVFSMRIFSVASIICLFLVLPLNYYGRDVHHKRINMESLEVFTIQNVQEGSRWLWAHCLALYFICCSAWILLYYEYKTVADLRQAHLRDSFQNPSCFAVLVRGIPSSSEENNDAVLTKFFRRYYPSTYVSHEMVYRCGHIVKLMRKAEKMYEIFAINSYPVDCSPCQYCSARQDSIDPRQDSIEPRQDSIEPEVTQDNPDCSCDTQQSSPTRKETGAAFVFFKTRYDAATVAQARQSSNPMLWVTDFAPEPPDVYWSNLCVPYRQFWLRRVGTLMATAAFAMFFLAPVTIVQSLANLQKFEQALPFLRGLLKRPTMAEVVTGYLPSVILILFLIVVPPLMMMFSTIEGSISRSRRKKAATLKVLYFNVWNVFFVNLISGTVLVKLSILSNPKEIPKLLATSAVPALVKLFPSHTPFYISAFLARSYKVKFFMTYVLTSGWTSLAVELAQIYPLLVNSVYKCVSREKIGPFDSGFTFPFHTEVPRVLLFGLFGFSFAILAPLILPLLLIYFCLAYFVYRNQILNVYLFEYDTGGQYWPIVHDTTVFSMVMAQIMALGVFVIKLSPVCIIFTIILMICTLLFNEYCRQRFLPIFKDIASQELIEMDQLDEPSGREGLYERVKSSYTQEDWISFTDSGRSRNNLQSPFVSELLEPEYEDSGGLIEGPDLHSGNIEVQPLWTGSYGSDDAESSESNARWPPLPYTGRQLKPMEGQPCPPLRYKSEEAKNVKGKRAAYGYEGGKPAGADVAQCSSADGKEEGDLASQYPSHVRYPSEGAESVGRSPQQHGRRSSGGSIRSYRKL